MVPSAYRYGSWGLEEKRLDTSWLWPNRGVSLKLVNKGIYSGERPVSKFCYIRKRWIFKTYQSVIRRMGICCLHDRWKQMVGLSRQEMKKGKAVSFFRVGICESVHHCTRNANNAFLAGLRRPDIPLERDIRSSYRSSVEHNPPTATWDHDWRGQHICALVFEVHILIKSSDSS
jgi:hypothetical protein